MFTTSIMNYWSTSRAVITAHIKRIRRIDIVFYCTIKYNNIIRVWHACPVSLACRFQIVWWNIRNLAFIIIVSVMFLFYYCFIFFFQFIYPLYVVGTSPDRSQHHNIRVYLTIQLQQGAKRKSLIKYNRHNTIIFIYIFKRYYCVCIAAKAWCSVHLIGIISYNKYIKVQFALRLTRNNCASKGNNIRRLFIITWSTIHTNYSVVVKKKVTNLWRSRINSKNIL